MSLIQIYFVTCVLHAINRRFHYRMVLCRLTNLTLLWVGYFENVAVHICFFMLCGTQQYGGVNGPTNLSGVVWLKN
jgi:hypothetical protein